MANIAKFNSRLVQKHDTEANWKLAVDFVPLLGELIIYDTDAQYTYQRFKIGNGTTAINNLPFIIYNPIWSGTYAEYLVADAAGLIPVGTIVCLTDDEGTSDGDNAGISTTSALGVARLGYMILGT